MDGIGVMPSHAEHWRLAATVNTCKTNHQTKGMCSCIILSAGSHKDGNTAQRWNKKDMSVVPDREMSYAMFPSTFHWIHSAISQTVLDFVIF